jgi:hypothetical protein
MSKAVPKDPATSLAQALVADLLELGDAELLRELAEEGTDPEQEAGASRAIIAAALIQTAKGLERPVGKSTSLLDPHLRDEGNSRARSVHERLASNDDMLANEITLAARNGRGLSRRELEDIVESLRELGALGEDDSWAP